ncbi:uncharacterized protein [Euphorbia lathyris]|uniref:uncharacterized protein isoform X5 n=1 Tax=Euphorbia lathyris TaxID=212925 RepID=UPI00331344C1
MMPARAVDNLLPSSASHSSSQPPTSLRFPPPHAAGAPPPSSCFLEWTSLLGTSVVYHTVAALVDFQPSSVTDQEDTIKAAAMEKISAACAMEWSMELEKALRSKKPGQAVKAIQQIGERLQLLSREPKPTMAVYNMFGLVAGEDRLFANAILLRLADAFRLGDNDTRRCIVRVFLSEFKNRDKLKKGRYCELAVDFASVVLDMLLNTVISPDTSLAVRLAGARVFAKMGCSYSIANRAHQIGVKLLIDSSDEDFSVAMLVSLSKLVAKSPFLLSKQFNLLLLFLNQEKTLRLQATAIRCLHFVLMKGVCQAPVRIDLIKLLLRIVDENETELPSAMQCEALQILRKMLVLQLPFLDCGNLFEFTQLLTIVEKSTQSPVLSKSLLAIRILIDMSIKLRGRTNIGPDGYCFSSLPRIFLILVDQITSLDCQKNSRVIQEFQSLLNHLLFLVGECPDLGVPILEETRSFVEYLVDLQDRILATRDADVSADEFVHFTGQKGMNISLNLVNNVQKFAVTCIENLNEVGAMTNEMLDKVKLLVESVHSCRLFESDVHLKYSILLHSRIFRGSLLNENDESSGGCGNFSTSLCQELVEYEILSLELADKMLRKRDYWHAYKAGIFAAYQGAWATASFIFGQLIASVQPSRFATEERISRHLF